MTTRTRNFVIVSLTVLGVGLGTGLVAYYVGFPAGALGRQGGPQELAFVPREPGMGRSIPVNPPASPVALRAPTSPRCGEVQKFPDTL